MKHKDLTAENVLNTLRILHRLLRLLMLTGWGLTSNSTKGNDIRVTNQTKAFQVVNAEIVGDVLNLVSKTKRPSLAERFSVRTHQSGTVCGSA